MSGKYDDDPAMDDLHVLLKEVLEWGWDDARLISVCELMLNLADEYTDEKKREGFH